jgi:hypothetical protein
MMRPATVIQTAEGAPVVAKEYVSDIDDDDSLSDDSNEEPPPLIEGPRKHPCEFHLDTGYALWDAATAQKPQLCYELEWSTKEEHPTCTTPMQLMKEIELSFLPELLEQKHANNIPGHVRTFHMDAVNAAFAEWLGSLKSRAITRSFYGKAITTAVLLGTTDAMVDALAVHKKATYHPLLDHHKLWNNVRRFKGNFRRSIRRSRKLVKKLDDRFPEAAARAREAHAVKRNVQIEKDVEELKRKWNEEVW